MFHVAHFCCFACLNPLLTNSIENWQIQSRFWKRLWRTNQGSLVSGEHHSGADARGHDFDLAQWSTAKHASEADRDVGDLMDISSRNSDMSTESNEYSSSSEESNTPLLAAHISGVELIEYDDRAKTGFVELEDSLRTLHGQKLRIRHRNDSI
jgi:hypothetical protein